jgi:hypothetical protein
VSDTAAERNTKLLIAVLFFCLVLLGTVGSGHEGQRFLSTDGDNSALVSEPSSTDHAQEEGREFFTVLGVKWKITDVLLVLFTGLLALYTALLKGSTDKLWNEARAASVTAEKAANAAKESADVGRAQFVAMHRPRIRVKHLFLCDELWRRGEIAVDLVIVNSGSLPAHILECNVGIHITAGDVGLPPRPTFNKAKAFRPSHTELPSGITYVFPELSDGSVLGQTDLNFIELGERELYCFGYVDYLDDGGRLRKTSFCRLLARRPLVVPTLWPFRKHDDPDYEYED